MIFQHKDPDDLQKSITTAYEENEINELWRHIALLHWDSFTRISTKRWLDVKYRVICIKADTDALVGWSQRDNQVWRVFILIIHNHHPSSYAHLNRTQVCFAPEMRTGIITCNAKIIYCLDTFHIYIKKLWVQPSSVLRTGWQTSAHKSGLLPKTSAHHENLSVYSSVAFCFYRNFVPNIQSQWR